MILDNEKLINKISVPVLPDVLIRKHLIALLGKRKSYKATWISSKAGSGKTTLAASYIKSESLPHVWYQFDQTDDVASFFYYINKALKHQYPNIHGLLIKSGTMVNKDPVKFAKRYFETLSSSIKEPFTFVFDNYQEINAESRLHDVIRDFIESVGLFLHIIILSRKAPHLNMSSQIANKNIHMIRENSLLMNKEESARIIQQETGLNPTQDELNAIYKKTAGWVAGLILMSINRDDSYAESLKQSLDMNHYINNYFESELFRKLDDTTKLFLIKTAILDELTPDVSRDITGVKDPAGLLSWMHESKYFIEKFSGDDQSYQYHPLFKDFLKYKLELTFSNSDIFVLKQKAALSLEKDEKFTLAANLFSRIKDYDNLIRLLQNIAHDLFELELYHPLIQLLEKIPADRLETSPWIQYWLGSSYRYVNVKKSFVYLKTALELFVQTDNQKGFIYCWLAISGTTYYARDTYWQLDEQLEVYLYPDYRQGWFVPTVG